MSGKAVNSEQVRVYMKTREAGKRQVTAAAKAGGIGEFRGQYIQLPT